MKSNTAAPITTPSPRVRERIFTSGPSQVVSSSVEVSLSPCCRQAAVRSAGGGLILGQVSPGFGRYQDADAGPLQFPQLPPLNRYCWYAVPRPCTWQYIGDSNEGADGLQPFRRRQDRSRYHDEACRSNSGKPHRLDPKIRAWNLEVVYRWLYLKQTPIGLCAVLFFWKVTHLLDKAGTPSTSNFLPEYFT